MRDQAPKGMAFPRIISFLEELKREYNAEYHVVLYTSIGRIVCDIEPPAKKSSLLGFEDDPTTITVDISAIFDNTDMFDSQLINAKNVIVYKNNSDEVLIRQNQMILFSDQILGFNIVKQLA